MSIVDTWWQTETGGILISPQTGAIELNRGSASKPFFGIEPCIVDKNGIELKGECEGMLCLKDLGRTNENCVWRSSEIHRNIFFSI